MHTKNWLNKISKNVVHLNQQQVDDELDILMANTSYTFSPPIYSLRRIIYLSKKQQEIDFRFLPLFFLFVL